MITKEFKLTTKSQVTIPDKVKNILQITSGDSVYFGIKDGHVEILPSKKNAVSIFDLGKKYKTTPKKKVSIDDMNKAIRKKQKGQAKKNK